MATKIMVVGDSISHGREGDWTWRYRIWEWFRQEGVAVRFVGPYKGTLPPDEPEPPRPPPLQSEAPRPGIPRSDGGYAQGVSPAFLEDCCHFAFGGRQAMQTKTMIAEQIAAYQPDLCLVELGFNDIAWCVSGPQDTLDSMERLVGAARSAKPDLQFAIANVPHRTLLPGREDIPFNTNVYNTLLARAIPAWSSPESPIALVRFCENYSCGEHVSDAAYDGLHPNALGEYQLAQAFSRTLVADFRMGRTELAIPTTIPRRPTPSPTNVKATPAPNGILVTWDVVYGAFQYEIRERIAGSGGWLFKCPSSNRHDTDICLKGQRWEYQVRASGGDTIKSPWSPIVSAVADPKTLPAPPRINTHATADGLRISWEPYAVEDGVDRYGVLTWDADIPGAYPSVVGINGSGGEIRGLIRGHRYGVSVRTWTAAGGGYPGGGNSVMVGYGRPSVPQGLEVIVLDRTTVELRWRADPAAAGYRIWVLRTGDILGHFPRQVAYNYIEHGSAAHPAARALLKDLNPSVWSYKYSVSAYNGDDRSKRAEWVVAPSSLPNSDVIITEADSLHITLAGPRDASSH